MAGVCVFAAIGANEKVNFIEKSLKFGRIHLWARKWPLPCRAELEIIITRSFRVRRSKIAFVEDFNFDVAFTAHGRPHIAPNITVKRRTANNAAAAIFSGRDPDKFACAGASLYPFLLENIGA